MIARHDKHFQLIFAALFVISTATYLTVTLLLGGLPGEQPSLLPDKGIKIVELLSLMTSIVSVIALFSGTTLSWVREKRAKEKDRLDQRLLGIRIHREEIALKREKAELEKLRAQTKGN